MTDPRPLILLDVDGVINDLEALCGASRPWRIHVITSHGYRVHVPDHMPGLMRHLARVAEIRWCTTWRERANDDIAPFLGVGPFPAIDDGTVRRDVDWKARAAYSVAQRALDEGRRVLWIEDFAGCIPETEMPTGVEFIDTAADGEYVLLPNHLPPELRPGGLGSGRPLGTRTGR